jgi:hypothetical protein
MQDDNLKSKKYFVIKSRDLKSVSHSLNYGVWAIPIRKYDFLRSC